MGSELMVVKVALVNRVPRVGRGQVGKGQVGRVLWAGCMWGAAGSCSLTLGGPLNWSGHVEANHRPWETVCEVVDYEEALDLELEERIRLMDQDALSWWQQEEWEVSR